MKTLTRIAALFMATIIGCIPPSKSDTDMTKTRRVKSVDEIQEACGRAASTILPDEDGETFPCPVKANGHEYIQVLFYSLTGELGAETIEVPHYCMWLDPYTAEVVRFWPCTPQEIGIERSAEPISPRGNQGDLSFETLIEKRERLSAISPSVWKLFFDNATSFDSETAATLREYRSLFWETSDPEETKFVVGASRDFFEWLDAVLGRDDQHGK